MKWQTKVDSGVSQFKISYNDKILFLGSCFAQEIGEIMAQMGFDVSVNPFGVLYNPASIALSLEKLSTPVPFLEEGIILNGDIYKSLSHSSEFSDMTKHGLLKKINESLEKSSAFFSTAGWISITLGTSWIYRIKSSGRVVANCHKLRSDSFTRENMSVKEIISILSTCIDANPQKKWIFNVSPVRYMKDGANGSQLSKARLMLALEELVQKYPNTVYFPSYEIVMDELRDYRFYAHDMIHVSKETTEYIWERFAEFILSADSHTLLGDYKKLTLMKKHRPMFPESNEFIDFEAKIKELEGDIAKKRFKSL
ncbi:MAG: hypothetical protein ACD_77C00278G0006 [uncultured bacterium]|nr:MAG: hypothetical protein ACD_77C00278G0006 [uncultured bacterium]HBY02083.1 GSCFA domain protein [Rikenellaceae bacterium]